MKSLIPVRYLRKTIGSYQSMLSIKADYDFEGMVFLESLQVILGEVPPKNR